MPSGSGEPPSVLRGFTVISLEPREKKRVIITLSRYGLSYWDVAAQGWRRPDGEFTFSVGASSRDFRLHGSIPLWCQPLIWYKQSLADSDFVWGSAEYTNCQRFQMCSRYGASIKSQYVSMLHWQNLFEVLWNTGMLLENCNQKVKLLALDVVVHEQMVYWRYETRSHFWYQRNRLFMVIESRSDIVCVQYWGYYGKYRVIAEVSPWADAIIHSS